jgi:hypothetical protein
LPAESIDAVVEKISSHRNCSAQDGEQLAGDVVGVALVRPAGAPRR